MLRAAYDSTFNHVRLVLLVQKGYGGIDWNSLPRRALLLPAPLQMGGIDDASFVDRISVNLNDPFCYQILNNQMYGSLGLLGMMSAAL